MEVEKSTAQSGIIQSHPTAHFKVATSWITDVFQLNTI